ncbi:MAG: hypothetical protein PHS74_13550 [Lachnospiraceae bacterium]|nr:hypothetical protein [Lachnospiraceae bacterium]
MKSGYIELKEVPKAEINIIGSFLYETIAAFYAEPENQQKFEEWKAKRQQDKLRRLK